MKRVLRLLSPSIIVAVLVVASYIDAGSPASLHAQEGQLDPVPYPDQRDAAQQAISWLIANHQNQDGGYTSFSAGADQAASDVGGTLDALLALSSAGASPNGLPPGKEGNPLGFLLANLDSLEAYAAADAGQAGKAVLALAAANQNPAAFGGIDLVALLVEQQSQSGQFGAANPFGQSLAILALAAVGEQVPATAVNWLMSQQAIDGELIGSWDDGFGTAGNTDATAMAIMALTAAQSTFAADSIANAADFLSRSRLNSGGWEYAAGFGENGNSTALAVQALAALGLDFYTPSAEAPSPIQSLLAWQGGSGAFQVDFGDGRLDDFYATVQSLPAAMGKPFPIPGRVVAARRALGCLATLRDVDTGGWEQFATFGVDAAGTSRAIQAIVAMREDPNSAAWTANGVNPVQALASLTPAYLASSGGGGAAGIVMQGVALAGGDVTGFAGIDLPLEVTGHLSPTGEYDNTAFGPFSHVEAMLGLQAAGIEPDPAAVEWLRNAHTNGDFGGADSTGIALQSLARLGIPLPEAVNALRASQEIDGGWGFGSANPSSTSEVVQGLVALGENPFGLAWSKVLSGTVVSAADAILRQQGENGCWPNLFGPGDDPFSTTDAILMLAAQPGWGSDRFVAAPELFDAEPQTVEATEPAEISETEEEATESASLATSTPLPSPEELTPDTVEPTSTVPSPIVASGQDETRVDNMAPLLMVGLALLLAGVAAAYLYRRG